MGVNYYDVLDVNKNVSDDDLTQAYWDLAMRWDPDEHLNDRTEAKAKFKQIAEAYEVLSDPQKKAIYDQYGEEGLKQGPNAFIPRNALKIFREFCNNPPFGFGSSGHADFASTDNLSRSRNDSPITTKPPSLEEKFPCDLEELYTGSTREVKIIRWVFNGFGKLVKEREMLTVDVMPGWKNGKKLTYPGKGNHLPDGLKVDLVLIIDEEPHDKFKRDGDDLILHHTVSLAQALGGTTVNIKTLDGRDLKIRVHDIISPGHEHVIPNEGMPLPKEPGNEFAISEDGKPVSKEIVNRGKLRIKFEVKFPTKLSEKRRAELKRILAD